MGTIRKVGEEYVVEFYAQGLKFQKHAGKDYANARRILKEIEKTSPLRAYAFGVEPITIEAFFMEVLRHLQQESTGTSFVRYEKTVRHFHKFIYCRFPHLRRLTEVTPEIVEHYRLFVAEGWQEAKETKRNKRIVFTFCLLRELMEHGIKRRYINDNPVLHVRLPALRYSGRPRFLQREEIQRLKVSADGRLRAVVECLLMTGMRLSEVINLQWKNVDLKSSKILIEQFPQEEGQGRDVPLEPQLRQMLEVIMTKTAETKSSKSLGVTGADYVFTLQDGSCWQEGILSNHLAELFHRCRLSEPAGWLTLRHTFARNMLQRDVSLIRLSRLLGLRDVAQMMYYAGYLPDSDKESPPFAKREE